MELKCNQVVQLRGGKYGVVACFNEKPFQLIFTSFTTPIARYDEKLKHKNNSYDIVKVYDGSKLANVTSVFTSKFNAEGLDVVWEETV